MIFRVHTMEPSADDNLRRFLRSYYAIQCYLFAPMAAKDDLSNPWAVGEVGILKRELNIREAWTIGRYDLDGCGIHEDDDPIIPTEHEADAPILDLLRSRRSSDRIQNKSVGTEAE